MTASYRSLTIHERKQNLGILLVFSKINSGIWNDMRNFVSIITIISDKNDGTK